MKEYILIELGNSYPHKLETYDSFVEAATAMRNLMAGNRNIFYRIEEVEVSIMDRVKNYDDACDVLNIIPIPCINEIEITTEDDVNVEFKYRVEDNRFVDHVLILMKLETITAALNEGWKPDWVNTHEPKYYVLYDAKADTTEVNNVFLCSPNSSRLYFKSRELAEYAAKQFAELYKQLLIEKF